MFDLRNCIMRSSGPLWARLINNYQKPKPEQNTLKKSNLQKLIKFKALINN